MPSPLPIKAGTLGAFLRAKRKARKMSQAEVAEAAGLNQYALSRYESNDRVPGAPILARLEKALTTRVPSTLTTRKSTAGKPRKAKP